MNTWTRLAATTITAGLAAMALAPAAHADVYDEFYTAVDWLGKKYGVTVYVDAAPLDPGTYAQTGGDEITLNSWYVDNPEQLHIGFAYDLYQGFHRGELCTAPQYVAAHEFGHALDNLHGRTARVELAAALRSGFGGIVSEYGTESPAEAIAESFAAVECGSAPTDAEKAIYLMLVN